LKLGGTYKFETAHISETCIFSLNQTIKSEWNNNYFSITDACAMSSFKTGESIYQTSDLPVPKYLKTKTYFIPRG